MTTKRLITCVLLLSTLTVAGQKPAKVIEKHSSNPFISERQEYEVLADDNKVKHGKYKKWVNDKLVEEGYYKNNKKDSVWTYYGVGQTIRIIGNYINDEKTGIWEYYINAIELEQEYDFTRKALVSFKPPKKTTIYQIISERDTIYAPLSRPPLIIGGSNAYLEKVAQNLRYPVAAMKSNIGGKVFVSFVIDERGKTSDFKVVKKGHNSLDNEALRVVALIDDWLPGIKDGKPVKVIHIVPIIFENGSIVSR